MGRLVQDAPARHITFAEIGLAVIAVGGVFMFGGVFPGTYSLMEAGVALLALAVFWRERPRISRLTAAILAVLLVVPLLQLVPLPRGVLSVVSPARLAVQEQLLTPAGITWGATPITVNAHATVVAHLKFVSCVLVFLLGFHIYRYRSSPGLLAPVLIGLGLFEAVYGMVQYLADWQYIWTYPKRFNIDVATGTYVDRNHYAGLLEMVLPFVLASIWFRFPGRGSGQSAVRRVFTNPESPRWVSRVLLFAVIFLALVFSQSRTGIALGLFGILMVTAIAFFQARRRSAVLIALVVTAIPLAFAAWIGVGPILQRFESMATPGSLESDRLQIWRDTVALIRDYPLVGTGLGTYRWASLHYQTDKLNTFYERAHNDYLEYAADIGIPAALLLFGSLWVLVAQVARRALALERSRDRILAAGCAGAMASLLLHSITEFNLQMPANAFLFAWIAGTAAGLVKPHTRPRQHGSETAPRDFDVRAFARSRQ